MSRSVVREATKALDFLGIIDAVPRRGMILDEFDFNRVSEYFGFHFALSDYPKEKLLKARVRDRDGCLVLHDGGDAEEPVAVSATSADAGRDGPRHGSTPPIAGSITTSPFTTAWSMASDITPLASFCDFLQAFFQKFRAAVMSNVRAGRQSHCEIVAALHSGQLEKATVLLRHHSELL